MGGADTLLVVVPFASPTPFDQFLAALLVFVTTPSQIIPAGVAAAAFVLSLINLVRSFRGTARPKLRASAFVGLEVLTDEAPEGDTDYRNLYVVIRNRGDSTAHDVRAIIRQNNGRKVVRELHAIEPDETRRESLGVHPENPADGLLILKYTRGPCRGVRVKFGYEEPF